IAQLFRDMAQLTPVRKREVDMGTRNNQRFFPFSFLFLKQQSSVDFGMVSLHLPFTHQNLYSKSHLCFRDFNNAINELVIDDSGNFEPQILKDGMDGID